MRVPDYPTGTAKAWAQVDDYFARALAPEDAALTAALAANAAAGLPAHDVSALQGRFLALVVAMTGAERVLEIGRLGGYSAIWMARALPAGGRITTIESDPARAGVAHANLDRAGLLDRVDLRVGPALRVLLLLLAGPFDLVFIDADKPNMPEYLRLVLPLSRPGTVILADNVVRGRAVADPASRDPSVRGVQAYLAMVAEDPRLEATEPQTAGEKGWDGFALLPLRTA
ncbi:MAG: O-methyltransferase [Rhodobacteraceae bacterium]|jgi:predicted O-methyltransferase YrrM|nr:O-methyltransferase [Paracoccaceae bacterium]